jgi:hypothetical protein
MTEIPNVSLRDTKTTIMDALKKTTKALNEAKAQEFNPAKAKAKAETAKAQARTDTKDWDLEAHFAQTKTDIDDHLRSIQRLLEQEKQDLDALNLTKKELNADLQELYGITREAQTFAALIESKREHKEAVDLEIAQERAELEKYVADQRAMLQLELENQRKLNEKNQVEWLYNFERQCKIESHKLQDKLAAEKKTWSNNLEAEEKALAERKEALDKQEAEIAELRAKVAEIPEALEAAAKEAQVKAQRSAAFEIQALKRNDEADRRILANEVQTLTEAKTAATEKIASLEAKLEHAYAQIQAVASKALEAQGNAATTAEVQRAVASATSGKGR